MKLLVMGSGQEVGRSCIIVSIGGMNIMFDCGMLYGGIDSRRFPDLRSILVTKKEIMKIDCLIISHIHLDHVGALPYFTEIIGYAGPIYATHPTRALLPIILEDYRKLMKELVVDKKTYTNIDILNCLKKITGIGMKETVEVTPSLKITPYHAGHTLGAAAFLVEVGKKSVLYTGDFQPTGNALIGPIDVPKLRPDLLISEGTYGGIARDSYKASELEFLQLIYDCIREGGKVLLPVSALGRSQEICVLIDEFWERMHLDVPVYTSGGLKTKIDNIYKMFTNYTVAEDYQRGRNIFDYKHITIAERFEDTKNEPMVAIMTPHMLTSGSSLNIFLKWCENPKNLIIIQGYCSKETIGYKILNGCKRLEIEGKIYTVKIRVENISLSTHADEPGIINTITTIDPKSVALVHGRPERLDHLAKSIRNALKIPVFEPKNLKSIIIPEFKETVLKIRFRDVKGIMGSKNRMDGVKLKLTIASNENNRHYIEEISKL